MDSEMIKVYEEMIIEDDGSNRIWLNDILDDEGIPYENKVIKDDIFFGGLTSYSHKIIEFYVSSRDKEDVLSIIYEYEKKLTGENAKDIPELSEEYGEYPFPIEVKDLIEKYNSLISNGEFFESEGDLIASKDDYIMSTDEEYKKAGEICNLEEKIIDECIKINLEEYNCKLDSIYKEKLEGSLIMKTVLGNNIPESCFGYMANYNIGDSACFVHTIRPDENNKLDVGGTYINFHLNNVHDTAFYYSNGNYNVSLPEEFIKEVSEFFNRYDITIEFSLENDRLDAFIYDYYIIDIDEIDDDVLTKKSMTFKFEAIKEIILKLKELIEKYIR